jgi:rhodanese-related sulfurtransferase
MTMPTEISATDAARLVEAGAVLVDIREADEHRRLRIPGAVSMPLSQWASAAPVAGGKVIFHCRTGMRTAGIAGRLAAGTTAETYLLAGGLDAWAKQGLPVAADRRQPLDIMRQVQIFAGALILAGVLLGAFVAPGFYALAGFVGAGLLMAGITGFCGMARLLAWFNVRLAPAPRANP